jgi:23S rRNA (cytosine1962-C5)-methyltransferase
VAATPSCSISRPSRIAEAVERRAALAGRPDLTAYRLVNGAGDGLPGVAIDRLDDVLVVHVEQAELVPDLQSIQPAFRAGYVKIHPLQASRARDIPSRQAWGDPIDGVVVRENGLMYLTRPAGGLATGLFLDMREVRAWVRQVTAGKRVLNLFAYTCAFGVSALAGGAQRVLNLDVSRRYLGWGQENYTLNGLPVDARDFVYGDALDWLGRFARRDQRFDLVIVDPPSFSSTDQGGAFSAQRDYPRLAEAAARVVAAGGILLAATNHAGISSTRFDALLARGVAGAGRQARGSRAWHEPAIDFPVPARGTPYLKVRALVLE